MVLSNSVIQAIANHINDNPIGNGQDVNKYSTQVEELINKTYPPKFLEQFVNWIRGLFSCICGSDSLRQEAIKTALKNRNISLINTSASKKETQAPAPKTKQVTVQFPANTPSTQKQTISPPQLKTTVVVEATPSKIPTKASEKKKATSPSTQSPSAFATIHQKLSALDRNSPKFKEKVVEILKDLLTLERKHPEFAGKLDNLSIALNVLLSSTYATPTKVELELLSTFKDQLKITTEYNPNDLKVIKESLQDDLLRIIKKKDQTLDQINSALEKKLSNFQEDALIARLKTVIKKPSETILNNLQLLIKAGEDVQSTLSTELSKKITELHELYDKRTANRGFSKLMENYRVLNMNHPETREKIINQAMSVVHRQLKNISLANAISADEIENLKTTSKEQGKKYALARMNAYYRPKYEFFVEDLPYIEHAYCQDDHPESHQNGGTCLQDAMNVHLLLLENPKIDSKDIPVGSNEKTRRYRALLNLQSKHFIGKDQKPIDIWKPFHLKPNRVQELKLDSNESKGTAIVNQLFGANKEPGTFIMDMSDEDGEGHVFNVQCQNGIYRFIDINTKVGKSYGSLEEFKKHFAKYIDAFYSDYKNFAAIYADKVNP